jgi:hypothetical protein
MFGRRNIPFINQVKYLGVIFDKRITWRLHLEVIEARAFGTFIRICSLLKGGSLGAEIGLALRREFIGAVMTCACSAWELAADTCPLELRRLQGKVLRTIGSFPGCTPVPDVHTAFSLPYVYDCLAELCRRQAEVVRNRGGEHIRGVGRSEAGHGRCERLKLGGGRACGRLSGWAAVAAWDMWDGHDLSCGACAGGGLVRSAKAKIFQ